MTLERDTLLHRRYRIVEILGQGGMGSVYRAVDENLGVDVAVKENLFTTDEYARQFRLEAVILASLRHPNLPRVSDHFVMGEQGQYLVMDFIEGEDLRQRMERLGMITEDDAVQIGAAICDALTYLHTRKPSILHRDIKPGNVKIAPDGHIYLVDFGLAKLVQGTQATTTGARAMTPGYSPPEQYGTARTDPRTDVYSLGATLYAALCGIIPEDGLARAMDNAQLTPLRKRNPKVSRRLAATIEKAMAVDPSDRFQTAEDFKRALLSSKSKTQQLTGSYTVAPPPPDAILREGFYESETAIDARQPTPVPPPPIEEDQPFVSPVKKQKERERKRRHTLIRFLAVLLVLLVVSIPFLAPGLLPADLRAAFPLFSSTDTPTPTILPSPLPTQTPAETLTATAPPTASYTPTNTPRIVMTATFIGTPTATAPTPLIPPTPLTTPVGGGFGQIAFASSRTGIPQLYLFNMVDGSLAQLTDMPDGACQPDWSPDGSRLVFISPCKGMDDLYFNAGLYMINADGGNLIPLPTVPGGDFDPAWSPDGNLIAFTSVRSSQMEIHIYNLADQTVRQLTTGAIGVESRQPAWSPDGTRIVYAVRRFGVYQIWLMDADGGNQQQIVRSGVRLSDYLPTWSFDGELILFNQRCYPEFCQPYLMGIPARERTTEQGTRLPLNVLPIEDVEYSPDGFWLVYEGEEFGENNDILYMTVTGGNRTPITHDKTLDFDPTWRPAR
jgi:serine/threonine protein kinase